MNNGVPITFVRLLAVACLLATGCAAPPAQTPPPVPHVFTAEGTAVATDDSPESFARCRAAAETSAKNGLVEKIAGQVIASQSRSKDLQFASHKLSARIRGRLSGARVIEEDSAGRTCTITVSVTVDPAHLAEFEEFVAGK